MNHPPFWWPNDIRAWATFGMFVLVAGIVFAVYSKPELADNNLFATLATLLVGTGGFGLMTSFLWGGTKSASGAVEAMTSMAATAAKTTADSATAADAGVTVKAEPDVDITVGKPD